MHAVFQNILQTILLFVIYQTKMKLLAILSILIALVSYSQATVTFRISNKDNGPIWIGIQGNPGKAHLNNGGFILNQGQTQTLSAADDWAGRFWSRTWCYANQNNHCLTGDCGNRVECAGNGGTPPATLIEFTLKGYGGLDYYDISLVDGYNTMASVQPVNGQGDGGQYSCKQAKCGSQINSSCPSELQLKNPDGVVIGCKSACLAFGTEQYCCSGSHNTPETCKSSDWPKNYPAYFKQQCPDAYSYAYDDHKSTFTCKASQYDIVFGGV